MVAKVGAKINRAMAIEEMPEKNRSEFSKILSADQMIEGFIPVYAKYFTEEQIQALIDFYSSDVGKHQLAVAPKIMEETMKKSIDYLKESMSKGVNP